MGIVSDAGVHDTVQGLSVRDLNHLRLSRSMIFQLSVWLWNIGCLRHRGLGVVRNFEDMAVVIEIQCYFHVAAFY